MEESQCELSLTHILSTSARYGYPAGCEEGEGFDGYGIPCLERFSERERADIGTGS
jgi:hypothetical protein